jgi:hypothetical protein
MPVRVLGWPGELPVVAVPAALGFTAFDPPVAGEGDGEFSVPSLPVVFPAPPVPE